MPITALPAQTVCAIGSSQALTDSSSLVKELLDNAIDGQATSISVEISANTLADIRVKDNGHGINPDDRPMVCQRHCTSKIRDLDELQTIGGRSLGFRGVALASTAELSGCLTISTKIEGEETACEMRFDRQGRLTSQTRTSLPVGTTVRVESFLEALPIRRKAAEKNVAKVMAKIRNMLQAYAIARPHLRISLKVLKAKDEKANWKYPINAGTSNSKSKPCIFNAATDILGRKVTDQCQRIQRTYGSSGQQVDTASEDLGIDANQASHYIFEAVIANPDCDVSVIKNLGPYLSVDGRPVSCERGILKQIVSTYKTHLRSLNVGTETKITNPVLCMSIVCPLGSYDANVEPAKDDVLFTNADLVIRLVENIFKSVYGEPKSNLHIVAGTEKPPRSQGFELMLARRNASPAREIPVSRPPEPASLQNPKQHNRLASQHRETSMSADSVICPTSAGAPVPQHADETQGARENGPAASLVTLDLRTGNEQASTWRHSMYDADEGSDLDKSPIEPARSDNDDILNEEHDLRSIQVSNPWAFAKLNTSFRTHGRNQKRVVDVAGTNQLPSPHRQAGDLTEPLSDPPTRPSPSAPGLPTPGRSQHQDAEQSDPSSPAAFPFPLRARGKRKIDGPTEQSPQRGGKSMGRGSLDAWVQNSRPHCPETRESSDIGEFYEEAVGPADFAVPGPFVSARTLPRGTPPSDSPDTSERPRRKAAPRRQQQRHNYNKTFVAPVNDLEKVWFDVGEKAKRKPLRRANAQPRQQYPDSLTLREYEGDESNIPSPAEIPRAPIHPDLALTLDYESRKQLATQQHRQSLRRLVGPTAAEDSNLATLAEKPTAPTPSPYKNRQEAAIAALHTSPNPSHSPTDASPSFAPNDPRAYLIRTTHSPQQKPNHRPLKRTKTALLPLETLHSANYTGSLIQHLSTKSINFARLLNGSGLHDDYVRNGIISEGFTTPTAACVREWEAALKELVKKSYRIESMAAEEEMEGDLKCDLMHILQQHDVGLI